MSMTAPPEADGPPAALPRLEVLKKRADFLRANSGKRQATPGFVLQGFDRGDDDPTIRLGFTCSKKVGNAVTRNRAKRRLREMARLDLPHHAQPGWDYVLIGRRETTASLPFETLREDLRDALSKLHSSHRA